MFCTIDGRTNANRKYLAQYHQKRNSQVCLRSSAFLTLPGNDEFLPKNSSEKLGGFHLNFTCHNKEIILCDYYH